MRLSAPLLSGFADSSSKSMASAQRLGPQGQRPALASRAGERIGICERISVILKMILGLVELPARHDDYARVAPLQGLVAGVHLCLAEMMKVLESNDRGTAARP